MVTFRQVLYQAAKCFSSAKTFSAKIQCFSNFSAENRTYLDDAAHVLKLEEISL